MKKTLLLLSVLFTIGLNAQDCSELFFSEYVEGYGQNKALEIYNPTSATIDLSNYQIERYANGATNSSAGGVTNLTGMLASGDVFVITSGETDTSSTFGYIDPVLFSMGDMAEPVGSYPTPLHMNGNDAMVLTNNNGAIIDVIGKVGEDPASGAWTADVASGFTMGSWWTANHTMIRKASVKKGVTANPTLFNPSLEWDSLPAPNWGNLGSHICDCLTPSASWDCISPGNCQDPGTGQGAYASLSACQSACVVVTPTWDCDGQGNCSDPGTGQGTYASLVACNTACNTTEVNETDVSYVMYPNPVNSGGAVVVNANTKVKSIVVINILGEQIRFNNTINTTGFAKGTYIITIEFVDGRFAKNKLIVE
jgi:hypothetical protein